MGSGKNETTTLSLSFMPLYMCVCVHPPTEDVVLQGANAQGRRLSENGGHVLIRLQYSISIVSPCGYFQRSVYVGEVFWGSYGWKSQGDSSPLLCTMNAREVEQTERGIHETQMEECGCCSAHTASPADLGVQDCHCPPPTFGSSSHLCSPLPSYVSPCYWSPCLFHCC